MYFILADFPDSGRREATASSCSYSRKESRVYGTYPSFRKYSKDYYFFFGLSYLYLCPFRAADLLKIVSEK